MPKLRVHNVSVSLDGYMAGPDQSLDNPLGVGAPPLHRWAFATRTGQRIILGQDGGAEGVDDNFMIEGVTGIGATIMGRNMFGPIRGPWGDEDWRGWWEEEPPFHHPVFVLTHHARPPLEMEGGTTFTFTDEPVADVLQRAFEAAGGQDVRLGGGASAIRQYLAAGLIDEMHLAQVPILLGRGERVFDNPSSSAPKYICTETVPSAEVIHFRFQREV